MLARLLASAICAVIPVFLGTPAVSAKWNYVRSPHFEFYSDGSKGNAQEVLRYLEQTREIFAKISPAGLDGDRPVRIVAFGSESGFKRFRPRESAYAFFARRRDRDYIVFQELDGDRMYEVAVHEYAHLRSAEMGMSLPVWMEEGLAELFSTVRPVGKTIRIGSPPQIVRVRGVGISPKIDEVVTASRSDDKLWKNNDKVVGLYARSWGLTHMLMIHERYRERFSDFLIGIAAGEKGETMFREVYQKDLKQAEKDMMEHVTGSTLPILTYTGEWDKWEEKVERRLAEESEAALVIADLLLVNGKIQESHAAFQAIVAQSPESAEAHVGLGRSTRNADEVRSHYKRAAELGSTDGWFYLDYARALLRVEGTEKAQVHALLEKAHELLPNEADPLFVLASLAEQAKDAATERSMLNLVKQVEAAQAFPFLVWKADALERAGVGVSANAIRSQAKKFAATLEQRDEIGKYLEKAGEPPDTRSDEANQALTNGEAARAVALLDELVSDYPLIVDFQDRLAQALDAAGDKGRAEEVRSGAATRKRLNAVQARKDDTDVLRRVSLLDAAGAYPRSQRFHDALMSLVPQQWLFPNNRAYDLAEKGQLLDEAYVLAERAVKLSEGRGACLDTLGWVQFKLKRYDDAIRTFEQAVAKEPKAVIYRYHLGAVYAEKGDKEKARATFEEGLKLKPSTYWQTKLRESIDSLT